ASAGRPLQAPVAAVLPLVAGALACGWLLRSLGLYRFAQGEGLAGHLARLVAAVACGAILALGLALLGRAPGAPVAALAWSMAVAATLAALHLAAFATVRRWRAEGRLTPNIVVVGATRHAERLIRDALKRR